MKLFRKLRLPAWRDATSGAATVEFVILFPIYMWIFLSAIEVGMLFTRRVMLDRALDITVRYLRLGNYPTAWNGNPTHDNVKATVCQLAQIIPNCSNSLKMQASAIVTRDPSVPANEWVMPSGAGCVDRSLAIQPANATHIRGNLSQLMMLRVCTIVDPFVKTWGISQIIPRDPSGGYVVASAATFVNEPQ